MHGRLVGIVQLSPNCRPASCTLLFPAQHVLDATLSKGVHFMQVCVKQVSEKE